MQPPYEPDWNACHTECESLKQKERSGRLPLRPGD